MRDMNKDLFTFHFDIQAPKVLRLECSVYLHPEVVKGFEARDCSVIFSDDNTSYLYGFTPTGTCVRCDSKYHR